MGGGPWSSTPVPDRIPHESINLKKGKVFEYYSDIYPQKQKDLSKFATAELKRS